MFSIFGFFRAKGPNPPSNMVIVYSGAGTTINYSFTDNSTDETGFRVEYSLNGGAWTFAETLSANDTSDSFAVPGYVDLVTQLQMRVRANGTGGDSDYTESNILNPL